MQGSRKFNLRLTAANLKPVIVEGKVFNGEKW